MGKQENSFPKNNFSSRGKGIVIWGEISTLYYEESFKDIIEYPTIRIQILDNITFPARSPTEYSIHHRDQVVFKSINSNAVEFESENYKFFLLKNDNIINISIVGIKKNFPHHFDTKVIEALQFVTAQRIKKTITETRENRSRKLRIQSIKATLPNTRAHPPIKYTSLDETGCIWKLFEKYLEFI